MSFRRKICVVTGSRAEYGLLYWLMKEILTDPALELQVAVTGMHLSPEFGLTVSEIEKDGLPISVRVEMLLSSDTPTGITKSVGLGVIGFSDALATLKPDLLVVLGDRFEILAAVQAALIHRIPVAHLHGGELTEGAIDESIRHAITKMSQLHFVAAEPYRQRVIQMGEQPERVHLVGAPGLDSITHLPLLAKTELEQNLRLRFGTLNFLVTYHPATLANTSPASAFAELLEALDGFPSAHVIMTRPNADTDGRRLIKMIENFVNLNPGRVWEFTSLGQQRYLSVMQQMDVVIGNSSSGLTEAPLMKIPTVNIGTRQGGRLRAPSVLDCAEDAGSIRRAIQKACSPEFRAIAREGVSVYGHGNASRRIVDILRTTPLSGIEIKHFHDMPGMKG
jgi:UDP-N-acetylglucosamine 2-epimerase (non-hydrolysing)/GDP/UDP-N,N'-diacetylbacillosamine 2-epimerase (hydrolysing)